MKAVQIYTTGVCPYCTMAKRLLQSRGVTALTEVRVDLDGTRREEMMRLTGRRTVPQVFVGETHVGGFDDLAALDRAGGLLPLLHD